LLYTLEETDPGERLTPDLGLVVEPAPVALEQRRAVGLPPLTGLLVRHVDPTGPAAMSGIRPGDLLRTANRLPLLNRHDLQLALNESHWRRRTITFEITRGAEPLRTRVAAPASLDD
jgi:serine protease Do